MRKMRKKEKKINETHRTEESGYAKTIAQTPDQTKYKYNLWNEWLRWCDLTCSMDHSHRCAFDVSFLLSFPGKFHCVSLFLSSTVTDWSVDETLYNHVDWHICNECNTLSRTIHSFTSVLILILYAIRTNVELVSCTHAGQLMLFYYYYYCASPTISSLTHFSTIFARPTPHNTHNRHPPMFPCHSLSRSLHSAFYLLARNLIKFNAL